MEQVNLESQSDHSLNCPKCGKEIKDENPVYCPFCGKPLELTIKRSGIPFAGGILAIVASCLTLFVGILQLIGYAVTVSPVLGFSELDVYALLYSGVFNIFCFLIGVAGGIFSTKSKHLTFVLVGISFLFTAGLTTVIAAGLTSYVLFAWLLFGMPIVILSAIAIIFAVSSKYQFT